MYTMVTIASLCWTFYFALYGNMVSALTCGITVIRLLVFMKRDTCKWARSIFWLYFFVALQIGVTILTSLEGFSWLNIFAVLAGFIGIFAYFVTNPRIYRYVSFIHMALWVVNSAVYFYPIALASDSFSTISCGVAICRFDLSKKARQNNKTTSESK